MRAPKLKIVSFSGIDGAGKSTQIQALESRLSELGFRPRVFTFWDNVVALPGLREKVGQKAFGGDPGVGTPDNPISRRDKNVTNWYMTAARLLLYFLDACSLRQVLKRVSRTDAGCIIFDRYLYDELANLPLDQPLVRAYVRLLLKFTPRPDVAFLLDAEPEAARLRKPEYPLEFLHRNRNAYLALSRDVGTMTVLAPGSPENTTAMMMRTLAASTLGHAEPGSRRGEAPALPAA